MPNGRSIVLERQQGADAGGYSGLEDEVDNHWGELFKAALLSTVLGVGAELGSGERKRILKELLEETGVSGPILYADHLVSDGPRLFAHACKLRFEGIISKKADARTGRNAATRGSRSSACSGRSFRLWDS